MCMNTYVYEYELVYEYEYGNEYELIHEQLSINVSMHT